MSGTCLYYLKTSEKKLQFQFDTVKEFFYLFDAILDSKINYLHQAIIAKNSIYSVTQQTFWTKSVLMSQDKKKHKERKIIRTKKNCFEIAKSFHKVHNDSIFMTICAE